MSDTLATIERATSAEELADALKVWAIEASDETGETPMFWILKLWEYVDGTPDESPGMTLEELIPETIAEWNRIRDGEPVLIQGDETKEQT